MKVVVDAVGLGAVMGTKPVFTDLSFKVARGELMLVEGPNGSGKSTLLKMLAGLRVPDAGVLSVHGTPAYVPQRKALFESMTVAENLLLIRRVQCIDTNRFERLAVDFGIVLESKKKAVSYSGGERKLIALAVALAGSGDLLLLDEPLSSLSETSGEIVLKALTEALAARNRSIIVAEHKLSGWANLEHTRLHLS